MSEPAGPRPSRRPGGRRRSARTLSPTSLPRAGVRALQRWQDYRERQLELLAESNELRREIWQHPPQAPPEPPPAQAQPALKPPPAQAQPAPEPPGHAPRQVGIAAPFLVGFVGALGVLVALFLADNLTRLTTVLTVLALAVFLTLILNPIVEMFTRRGMSRQVGVGVVFLGLIGLGTALGFLVAPPVVLETTTLIERTPRYLTELGETSWVQQMEEQYGVSDRLLSEIDARISDNAFLQTLFGGVLGAAGAVVGGLVGFLTALILTLYLLATLPAVKDAAYKIVPASRRPRVIALAEEIMRRVGAYALGQIAVASINGVCSWILLEILGLPYPVVLAVVVGLLGLIPMVGATLGATIVAVVAVVQDPTLALAVVVYYIVYQQLENYVIVPRIMARTVSVPGAVTVISVFVGATLLGVLGALIAIPVAAGMLLLYEEVVVPRQSRV